ncbi:MAG: hypothetical protein WC729_03510 [Sphingomonas sp.]|jgi:hypothetical protein|uniref:hypothetical protein n=1 Tax=Sphingomonas sp. TaxID=28214 RepID=UPI0035685CB7
MLVKTLLISVTVVAVGVYSTRPAVYSRDIDRPVGDVIAAIQDGDIRRQPGEPGTDAVRSGGVLPVINAWRTADSVTWIVKSRDQTAMTMTAKLTPTHGGAGTRLTAWVEKGNADPDYVSPAFRSPGITRGLFVGMLEKELSLLTGDKRHVMVIDPPPLTVVTEQGAKTADGRPTYRLHAFSTQEPQPTRVADDMVEPLQRMRPSADYPMQRMQPSVDAPPGSRSPSVSFEPGKPMVDPSRP